jgi:hypothetical protein
VLLAAGETCRRRWRVTARNQTRKDCGIERGGPLRTRPHPPCAAPAGRVCIIRPLVVVVVVVVAAAAARIDRQAISRAVHPRCATS